MLILASRSPRRAELLSAAGIEFTVRPADIDETPLPDEDARAYVLRVSREKAEAVPTAPEETVLAADTTVVIDGEILGKPADFADAANMLRKLSGCRHEVITGICLRRGAKEFSAVSVTAVWFSPLTDEEIDAYVQSGEPMDKAGAYAIQGLASLLIPRIEGSYANVVGLPVDLVARGLKDLAA
jgi:septum formation protein